MNGLFNIGIIGGGAAGLMAAITAAENGSTDVAVFESGSHCGTKILMSGGTRCNVTNQSVKPEHFFGNRNIIKNILMAFGDKDAYSFFESVGIKLKLEPGGKYFPEDDDAGTVLDALLEKAAELKIKIFNNTRIESAEKMGSEFILKSGSGSFTVRKMIITTGGKSYPSTGSDGSGYEIASAFGHKIITPFPALTPILLNEPDLISLSGVTIPAQLKVISKNKVIANFSGSLLFTHFGISGPCALNISREVERLKDEEIILQINFIPELNRELLENKILEIKNFTPNKALILFFREMLPVSLVNNLFEISGISSGKKLNSLSSAEIKTLTKVSTEYNLKFTGVRGFKQAEVTAGGIPLNEVKYQTMESRIIKNLYFAGEILDADGIIGGYNFQWAWSTGFIAGKSAAASQFN